jgi:hypothetical protein
MGQVAAVMADLAIAPFAANSIGGDMVIVEDRDLPKLGAFEVDLKQSPAAKGPAVEALAEHIRQGFAQLAAAAA